MKKKLNFFSNLPDRLPVHSYKFCQFIGKFIEKVSLELPNRHVVVGLSGGVDSVALAQFSFLLLESGAIKSLEFIHIDHGTRPEIAFEKSYLKKWSSLLGVKFISYSVELDLTMSNFEAVARKVRYKIFAKHLNTKKINRNEALLLLGHHLDDSFEWHLMQSFKSSSLETGLGIPLLSKINGIRVFRPFLCVSKDQILRFAKEQQLIWFEDSSNRDLSYERNYIRNMIKENIAPRYPQYLKHYVYKSNLLARKLGVSAFDSWTPKKAGQTIEKVYKRPWGHILRCSDHLGEDVLPYIFKNSKTSRGKVASQFEKLREGFVSKKQGPYSFSGGVHVYIFGPYLIITSYKNINLLNNGSQIPDPVPFFSKSSKKLTLKKPISLFSRQMNGLLDEKVHFTFSWRSPHGKVLFFI